MLEVFKIRIFCNYTFYKVNLKDYRIVLKLLFVQYIVTINKKENPVELKSHYM